MTVIDIASTSHLFDFDEQRFIKERPFNPNAVRAYRKAREIAAMEDGLSALRDELDAILSDMRKDMGS